MSGRLFPSAACLALALLLAACRAGDVRAQGANGLLLTGGRVLIVIDQVDAQGNLLPASSQKARLIWGKRQESSKITVSMVRYGPEIRLTVEGINAQNSSPVGPVELDSGMPEMDFVVGIPPGLHGSVRLRYVADASTLSGALSTSGEVDHVVTYTITAN